MKRTKEVKNMHTTPHYHHDTLNMQTQSSTCHSSSLVPSYTLFNHLTVSMPRCRVKSEENFQLAELLKTRHFFHVFLVPYRRRFVLFCHFNH